MKKELTLVIQKPFVRDEISISWVTLVASQGSFLVGPGHVPMVVVLRPESALVYKADGSEKTVEVGQGGGLAHIAGGRVVVFFT